MGNILSIIPSLKICYLILIILVMTIINIWLNKKQINVNYKYLINGITLIILAGISNYFSDIIDGIFNLNFLSVKFYIVILLITNIITLITMQKKLKPIYKVTNYILFTVITIILAIILVLIIGTKLNLVPNPKFSITLLNLSIIIFIIYLIALSIIYIVTNLKNKEIIKPKEKPIDKKVTITQLIEKIKIPKPKEKILTTKDNKILSPEDLLSLSKKEDFYINGVDCSIIFEDSVPENIIKNYNILLNDINAKLVNGYTLEENKLLKSVCTKLQTSNINNVDIDNLSILNKISIEEYNFLKNLQKN